MDEDAMRVIGEWMGNRQLRVATLCKRVFFTYLISLGIVSIIMTLIQQAPWGTNWILALKRIVIVAFPASMSGTLVDTIR